MNYSKISFPIFGLEINPDRVLQLGPVQIYYYGLIIAIGLSLAAVYGLRRCKQFGLKQDDVIDGALLIIPFAVLCARLYYCIFQCFAGSLYRSVIEVSSQTPGSPKKFL